MLSIADEWTVKMKHLKRRKDGRFVCRYKGRQFYGRTESEAIAARDAFREQERAGLKPPETVQDYAPRWLSLHKSDVSPKCRRDYEKQLETLCSIIGRKRLSDVSVDDAARVWTLYKGKSQSLLKRSKMLFTAMFDAAVENGYALRNPFRSRFASPPKGTSGTHRTLTDEEIAMIQSVPHRMRPYAMVMLFAGLRRGEALALTAADIGTDIRVSKSVRFEHNRPIIVSPKSSAGIRTVPVFSPLCPFLCDFSPAPMSETQFRRGWESYMKALSKAAGKPVNIRPHDLRHTFCTRFLRDAGVELHQAIVWMGHSDEKMILKVYDHIEESRTADSIKTAENHLSSIQNGIQKLAPIPENPPNINDSSGIERQTPTLKAMRSNRTGRTK